MHGYAKLFAPTLAHQAALRQTYAAMESYFDHHFVMPTRRELGEVLGVTGSTVSLRLIDMEQLGWISLDKGRSQSIVLRGIKD